MKISRRVLLTSGPATTTITVKKAQVITDICPREEEFNTMLIQMSRELVQIVHGSPNEYTAVLFGGSGTMSMDVCINSLLPEKKKILIINNGVYSRRAVAICICYGIPYIDLQLPYDKAMDLNVVEKTLQDNSDIALVYTTHNETTRGLLNPIREVGKLSHKYNAVFVVDTLASYGMIPIDIKHDNIDFCMGASHKGLMAMSGISFVIGRNSLIEQSAKFPQRSFYCNLYLQYNRFCETGEMHFTPPTQTIFALRQAIDEYWEEGEFKKWERHKRVYEAIVEGIESLGMQCLIDKKLHSKLVVAVCTPKDPNWNFEKIQTYCYKRGFEIYPQTIADGKAFRLAAFGAIDREDIEKFFKVFRTGLEEMNVILPVKYTDD